jgi:hypothetical protein
MKEITNNQPAVRFLFEEIDRQQVRMKHLSERTGITATAMAKWRTHHSPNIDNIEAALNALGYTLKIRKIKK